MALAAFVAVILALLACALIGLSTLPRTRGAPRLNEWPWNPYAAKPQEREASAPAMWAHICREERAVVQTACGEPCSWCGEEAP